VRSDQKLSSKGTFNVVGGKKRGERRKAIAVERYRKKELCAEADGPGNFGDSLSRANNNRGGKGERDRFKGREKVSRPVRDRKKRGKRSAQVSKGVYSGNRRVREGN